MNDMQPDGILGMKFVPGVAGFIGGCVALSFIQGLSKWQDGAWVVGPAPVPEALTPSQFWQQIEADGLTSAADALIDGLLDPLQRIRARRVVEYRRDDAQLIAMATALGMGAEQIDEFFRQACKR